MPARQSKSSKVEDQLKQEAALFARKATQLSNLLHQSETFLESLPGKMEVVTQEDSEDYQLQFVKQRGGWLLLLAYNDGDGDWQDVPVTYGNLSQKIEAAKRLPELYKRLLDEISSSRTEIESSLKGLKELPFLDFEAADEEAPNVEEGSDPTQGTYDDYSATPQGGFPDDEIPF
jgi:hypothetical protein